MNICAHYLDGAAVLDLCAGSGALGFEALSTGAACATFVDLHPKGVEAIRSNAKELGVQGCCTVIRGRAETVIETLEGPYDLIFLDPPYDAPSAPDMLRGIDKRSDDSHFLSPSSLIIFESPHTPPPLEKLKLLKEKGYGNTKLYIYSNNINKE